MFGTAGLSIGRKMGKGQARLLWLGVCSGSPGVLCVTVLRELWGPIPVWGPEQPGLVLGLAAGNLDCGRRTGT